MKKIGLVFFLTFTTMFAQEFNNMGEIHSKILEDRGREQFRQNIISKKFGRNGYSNSNQYIDYIGELKSEYDNDSKNNYNSKTKGILLGTNSSLLSDTNTYLGVSLGYLKSNVEYQSYNSKIRTYGIDYYFGKNFNNWIIFGNIGYTESKNIYPEYRYRTKTYSIGYETGYIFSITSDKILYPYFNASWSQYTIKAHNNIKDNDDKLGSISLGINYTQELNDKFFVSLNTEWKKEVLAREDIRLNNGNKIEGLDIGKDTGIFDIKLGYYIKPNFLLGLGYKSFLNTNYYYDMFTLSFSHNF